MNDETAATLLILLDYYRHYLMLNNIEEVFPDPDCEEADQDATS